MRKFLLLLLCGCGDGPDGQSPQAKNPYEPVRIYSSFNINIDKVAIDGQKFLVFRNGAGIAVVEADPQPESVAELEQGKRQQSP